MDDGQTVADGAEQAVKGIVGAAISIESIRGTRKLSQNKSDEDLDGVAAALKRRVSQQDLDIVARIELVRQRRT